MHSNAAYTKRTWERWQQIKQESKNNYIARKVDDKTPTSGIQPWSRFQVVNLADIQELGFIHGANGRARLSIAELRDIQFDLNPSYSLESIVTTYDEGWFKGHANHKPFNDNGSLK